MRISKFLITVFSITLFCLLYVYQQTEIFLFAYAGQKQHVEFQDLLDKNHILRYNIEKRSSLVRLGDGILKYADFQMPDSYRLVRSSYSKEALSAKSNPQSRETILAKIFSIKREAQARTINP